MENAELLRIATDGLECFSKSDAIFLRDPRRGTRYACLVKARDTERPIQLVHGSFIIRYDYTVSREQGVRFVEVTGDTNRIHRDSDIVAGALTASKILCPLEILCPEFEALSATFKFVGFSRYGKRVGSTLMCKASYEGKMNVTAVAYQDRRPIVKAEVAGDIAKTLPPSVADQPPLNEAALDTLRAYFESLGVDAAGYFDRVEYMDYTYPLAYLASLPSGELVRMLSGQGGTLNVLKLERHGARMPIIEGRTPQVTLRQTRQKTGFNRILVEIAQGGTGYCRGSVIVNPRISLKGMVGK